MSKSARRAAAVAVATETVAPVTPVVADAPKSIRSLIRTQLLLGTPTKEIGAMLTVHFPQSAAAAKSVKHIAFYRAQMKKAGELPVVRQATAS